MTTNRKDRQEDDQDCKPVPPITCKGYGPQPPEVEEAEGDEEASSPKQTR